VDNANRNPISGLDMKKKEIKSTFYEYDSLSELNGSQQQLIEEALRATDKAYAPYSDFFVGAAVLMKNNKLLHASNQENSAYPSGLCAERTAVFYANAQYPDIPVTAIAIAARKDGKTVREPIPPCGSCLQVLLESQRRHKTPMQVILYGSEKIYVAENIEQFLPYGFSAVNLRSG